MTSEDQHLLTIIRNFLSTIGISVVEQPLPQDTFLPGLSLSGASVLLDPTQLKYPGDLLHEAGHIAVTEAHRRAQIGTPAMGEDWPNQGEEMVVILWTYAACLHLNLDLEVVFHANGYKNESTWLIEQFSNNNYMGLHLMEWMGLCDAATFPTMKKWLR